MGKRGPKADPDQAAKGFPGRRRSKATKAADEAARLTTLIAPRPVSAQAVDVPAMLQDPKYAPAAAVWRQLAPELKSTHRLPREAEFYFVQLCIYAQEWVATTDDLHTNGFTQSVSTVAGGKMERRRPPVQDRQQAFSNLMDLSSRFGLTPHDMYSLFKGQAMAAVNAPGLFRDGEPGSSPASSDAPPADAAPAQGASRIGGLAAFRSQPPAGVKPN